MKFLVLYFLFFTFGNFIFAQNNYTKKGTPESIKNIPIRKTSVINDLFIDDMNSNNSVPGLEARGWVVLNEDTGGVTPPFYQGIANTFPAYEGPDTGYVAANYLGANALGVIDQWLISPEIAVVAGDSLKFWFRSPDGNQYDDSIYVRYSTTADTLPSDFDMTWGRYLVSDTGWVQWTGTFSTSGTIRFAVQYYIWWGGSWGTHSNYIGLDYFEVAYPVTPVELISFTASTNNGSIQIKWTTATETNNHGFDIERSQRSEAGSQNWEKIGFVAGSGTTTQTKLYSFVDNSVGNGTYSYRLKQIDFDGSYKYSPEVGVNISLPNEFSLSQNYPNPFNPTTTIKYAIPKTVNVELKVFDILGREVRTLVNEIRNPGYYEVQFNASNFASGVYFYRMKAGEYIKTGKMLLIK